MILTRATTRVILEAAATTQVVVVDDFALGKGLVLMASSSLAGCLGDHTELREVWLQVHRTPLPPIRGPPVQQRANKDSLARGHPDGFLARPLMSAGSE